MRRPLVHITLPVLAIFVVVAVDGAAARADGAPDVPHRCLGRESVLQAFGFGRTLDGEGYTHEGFTQLLAARRRAACHLAVGVGLFVAEQLAMRGNHGPGLGGRLEIAVVPQVTAGANLGPLQGAISVGPSLDLRLEEAFNGSPLAPGVGADAFTGVCVGRSLCLGADLSTTVTWDRATVALMLGAGGAVL